MNVQKTFKTPILPHSNLFSPYFTSFEPVLTLFYLIRMCSILMFSSITGVTEGLRATRELAHVGLLPGVGSQVGLQVLQTRVRFTAALKLNNINSQLELVAVMKQSNRGQNVWTKRV